MERDEFGQGNGYSRVITEQYFGYLVGQVREVLEASISSEKQLKAIESLVLDRMYGWFGRIGDQLTPEEAKTALHSHWVALEEREDKGETDSYGFGIKPTTSEVLNPDVQVTLTNKK
ncbi:MAG: hypothetical protein Q8910_12490 [Bacteroidota bacterium]|nr:hypothetical protein [Bacteroidota bacterium]